MIAFILKMPGSPSWNGRWSGENRLHAIVKNLGYSKKAKEKEAALDGETFYHRWSDGWCAQITAKKVDATEARKMRKASVGFSGYDWMVDDILFHGDIRNAQS